MTKTTSAALAILVAASAPTLAFAYSKNREKTYNSDNSRMVTNYSTNAPGQTCVQ